MRWFYALLLLAAGFAHANELTTSQAIIEVSDLYPGSVLSAEKQESTNDIEVRLLSPTGTVHKLAVCKLGVNIEIKEITGESSSSGRSACDSLAAKG